MQLQAATTILDSQWWTSISNTFIQQLLATLQMPSLFLWDKEQDKRTFGGNWVGEGWGLFPE